MLNARNGGRNKFEENARLYLAKIIIFSWLECLESSTLRLELLSTVAMK